MVAEPALNGSSFDPQVKGGVMGCGGMGREGVREILTDFDTTNTPMLC